MATRRVTILGSTGSIGTQTIAVIDHLNRLHERGESVLRFEIVALATGANASALAQQARALNVNDLAIARRDGEDAPFPPGASVRDGPSAAADLVRDVDCDLVVCAMVGSAGLAPTLAAVELGRTIALANKETLVAGGELVMAAARRTGSTILPIDSEHAAAWQLIRSLHPGYTPPMPAPASLTKLTLTASGGPFRSLSRDELAKVTPRSALDHPTWSMGPKNTIDSATLMNKALELIEARWLFDLSPDRLDAIIQPTSIVHALAETADGSILAQLSTPDMRLPIQQALTHPARLPPCIERLDLHRLGSLCFEPIDESRFGAIALAREVLHRSGAAGAILNAANEIAVQAFLDERLAFTEITPMVARALDELDAPPADSLEAILAADAEARQWAHGVISR